MRDLRLSRLRKRQNISNCQGMHYVSDCVKSDGVEGDSIAAVLDLCVTTLTKSQIRCLQLTTVDTLQLRSRNEIILWFRVTTTRGTVLEVEVLGRLRTIGLYKAMCPKGEVIKRHN